MYANEQLAAIGDTLDDLAGDVACILQCVGEREDALDIPEFMAHTLIDLVERWAPISTQRIVAKRILSLTPLPADGNVMVKRYFNLAY